MPPLRPSRKVTSFCLLVNRSRRCTSFEVGRQAFMLTTFESNGFLAGPSWVSPPCSRILSFPWRSGRPGHANAGSSPGITFTRRCRTIPRTSSTCKMRGAGCRSRMATDGSDSAPSSGPRRSSRPSPACELSGHRRKLPKLMMRQSLRSGPRARCRKRPGMRRRITRVRAWTYLSKSHASMGPPLAQRARSPCHTRRASGHGKTRRGGGRRFR
mmetsp:Transcript_70242/g.164486  ORF Transcript_70242/g.164486 Transcript_70242/m.164486 type:complete len:213 (-) Transcript_70242:849-1487(-)